MSLKRKVAIGVVVALIVAGLGLGSAWVTGASALKSETAKIEANSDDDKKQVSKKSSKDVVNEVTDNASKALAADEKKIYQKKDTATDSAVKAEDKKADAAKPSTGSNSAPSKSDSKPSSGSAGKPSHEHAWQMRSPNDPVYETRTRTVIDQPAWDETVSAGYDEFRFSDGYVTTSLTDAISHQDGTGCSYSIYMSQVSVHHAAVTHVEQYQVQTGTK